MLRTGWGGRTTLTRNQVQIQLRNMALEWLYIQKLTNSQGDKC